jgi:glycosyltransferase involved in cell wall biosynthesis
VNPLTHAHPSVSVVIPTYDRAHTLVRAVTSCHLQTYPLKEIIVVDDGSTDATPVLFNKITRLDPRIRYIRLTLNRGAQYARLRGIHECTGDWIAFLDSDDELLPDSIWKRLASAETSNIKPGLVYGDVYLGTADGRALLKIERFSGYAYPWLCKELSLCTYTSIMVRRDCFDTVGFPSPAFPSWQDDDMVLTIGKAFPILHAGEPVAIMHSQSGSFRISSDKYGLARGCRLLVRKYRADILRYHGYSRLTLWHLRVLHLSLLALCERSDKKPQNTSKWTRSVSALQWGPLTVCRRALRVVAGHLKRYLDKHFDHIYC